MTQSSGIGALPSIYSLPTSLKHSSDIIPDRYVSSANKHVVALLVGKIRGSSLVEHLHRLRDLTV